jgi:ribosomal protein L40E
MSRTPKPHNVNIACLDCMLEEHMQDAEYCRKCGGKLLLHL